MYIIKVCLKRLITFTSPKQGDRDFLEGSAALILGSCVAEKEVHTVCKHTFLGFLGDCKISLLKFVTNLILPNKTLSSTFLL